MLGPRSRTGWQIPRPEPRSRDWLAETDAWANEFDSLAETDSCTNESDWLAEIDSWTSDSDWLVNTDAWTNESDWLADTEAWTCDSDWLADTDSWTNDSDSLAETDSRTNDSDWLNDVDCKSVDTCDSDWLIESEREKDIDSVIWDLDSISEVDCDWLSKLMLESRTQIDSRNRLLNQRVGLTRGNWFLNQRVWLTGRYWFLNQWLWLTGWNRRLSQRIWLALRSILEPMNSDSLAETDSWTSESDWLAVRIPEPMTRTDLRNRRLNQGIRLTSWYGFFEQRIGLAWRYRCLNQRVWLTPRRNRGLYQGFWLARRYRCSEPTSLIGLLRSILEPMNLIHLPKLTLGLVIPDWLAETDACTNESDWLVETDSCANESDWLADTDAWTSDRLASLKSTLEPANPDWLEETDSLIKESDWLADTDATWINDSDRLAETEAWIKDSDWLAGNWGLNWETLIDWLKSTLVLTTQIGLRNWFFNQGSRIDLPMDSEQDLTWLNETDSDSFCSSGNRLWQGNQLRNHFLRSNRRCWLRLRHRNWSRY